ncbi:MAG: glutathione S-transferase family protein, partial [Betaproteobacteria bacterium]|nr:glutathione S-transferase family protein [Betaproteobacteria bacterium]
MKLYADPITVNCRKVFAGFDLLGTKYELVKVDYFQGEQKSPEYLAINPNASIPALVDGDLQLWESNAILQYAADKSSLESAYPKDLKQRADINRWLLWEANQWFPSAYIYLVENVVKPLLKAQPDKSVTDAAKPNFDKLASILEQRLQKQPWLCGQSVTIADIAVASPMHLHSHQKLPLEPYPSLRRWYGQLEAMPAWKK